MNQPQANTSQIYIGTQNGVVVCVDRILRGDLIGKFYHSYSLEAQEFLNLGHLLFQMETLFNELKFPYPSTNERHFHENPSPDTGRAANRSYHEEKREKIMNDEQLLMKHGDLGSFIIRVQHRQNSSWQGRITWIEKNKTVYFRSVWEMMKLIENAIDSVAPRENEEPEPGWPDSAE
ncbi:MAG: hypothetical protein IJ106_13295 [Parasporobacterium sp.]|nr:hypothetical protein [Parasporobacterium sp.]